MTFAGIHRRALVDDAALTDNVARAGHDVFDARANAYGHGLLLATTCAREAGSRVVAVSTDHDAALIEPLGFEEVRVGRWQEDLVDPAPLYGLGPDDTPVLSLVGELIAVKPIRAGEGVSYGYTYRPSTATTLGLVALGYADGVPRLASNRVRVAVEGVSRPLVGRIAMDQLVIDLGSLTVRPGMQVSMFGSGDAGEPTTREWAAATGRTALALTAGLGSRIERVRSKVSSA